MLRCAIFFLTAASMWGQGSEPKPKATDYPSHEKAGELQIGAENWGHGFSSKDGTFTLEGFIAVEVAVYTERNIPVRIAAGEFTLTINGSKVALLPQPTELVAGSLKYSDWGQRPELVGTAGAGVGDIIFGRRRTEERFPGDPRARGGVNLPRAPEPEPQGAPAKPAVTVGEALTHAALPAGEVHPPVSGFLFFAYRKKMKGVKTAVLNYEGKAGTASIMLR
jgi:hypothetical protein